MTVTELEVHNFYKANKKLSLANLVELFVESYPEYRNEETKHLYQRVKFTHRKVANYIKNKKKQEYARKLEKAESEKFPIFEERGSDVNVTVNENSTADREVDDLVHQLHSEISALKEENDSLKAQCTTLSSNVSETLSNYEELTSELQILAGRAELGIDSILESKDEELDEARYEIQELESKYFETKRKLDDAQKKVSKYCTRNIRRREERHMSDINKLKLEKKGMNATIRELTERIQQLNEEKQGLVENYEEEQDKVQLLLAEKVALQKRHSDLKIRKGKKIAKVEEEKEELKEEIDKQWNRIKTLEKANTDIQEIVDLCEREEIQTFSDGKFVTPLREVIIKLIGMNIGHRNIVPAIRTVVENLTSQKLGRLPSYGTVNKMVHEAKCLALIQAGKSMLQDKEGKAPSNILLEDATSKRRKTYNAVVIGTSEGLKQISLPNLARENAETLVEITKESFDEVASVLSELEGGEQVDIAKEMYKSVSGTMSDSCEVMKKFNKLMSEVIVKESGDEGRSVLDIKNHYCFLHVIINLGDDAMTNGLVDLDKCSLPSDHLEELHATATSTTYSAILLAARMMHQMGSEKYGKADLFNAFVGWSDESMQESEGARAQSLGSSRKGTQALAKSSYFEREVGNRAHITFHNGNALWYHKDDIARFIDLHKGDNTISEPMKTLERLLQSKVCLAGARALGIIKHCLTGPFQNAFDMKCNNIYEIVPYAIKLQEAFQRFSQNGTSLLENPQSVFEDIPLSNSQYTDSLYCNSDSEFDALTIMAIELVLKNMLIKFERYCKNYLAGGQHENASEQEKESMRNCPMTNRACESIMAKLDHYVKSKPNATPGFLEALTVFKGMELSKYDSLPEEEKEKQWVVARKYAQRNIENNKKKLSQLVKARQAILREKEIEKKQQASCKNKNDIKDSI